MKIDFVLTVGDVQIKHSHTWLALRIDKALLMEGGENILMIKVKNEASVKIFKNLEWTLLIEK